MNLNSSELLIRIPVVLLALTVHEFCHAYFAYRMGDPTAYRLGRCSLNPLRHLDPLGTICLMFAPIGWAKPVPINHENFRRPPGTASRSGFESEWTTGTGYYGAPDVAGDRRVRRGILISTAAGPLSNLAQAVLWALILRGIRYAMPWAPDTPQADRLIELAWSMAGTALMINVGLAVFNCLPLYPLDGFHILLQLIKPGREHEFAQTARYGPFMIIGLVLLGNYGHIDVLGKLMNPVFLFLFRHVAGLPG